MTIHPFTRSIVAAELAAISVLLPTDRGLILLGLWLAAALILRNRSKTILTGTFVKVLAVAALFLFLMHGMRWIPPGISPEGIARGLDGFVHVAAPVVLIVYLSRSVLPEEMYAGLIDLRVPPLAILILFRTLWLVPRFIDKTDEVMTALRLRGMRIETPIERARALVPTLNPILSSMFEEISENSLTMTARGFLAPGTKSHLLRLSWTARDFAALVMAILLPVALWW